MWSAGDSGTESTISVSTGESTTASTPGYPPTTLSGLTNVEWIEIQRSNAITAFTGIAVNNILLIDANIQDTVLDTPLTDYAVLDPSSAASALTISNGNLQVANTSSDWRMAKTDLGTTDNNKYYWEFTATLATLSSSNYSAIDVGIVNANAPNDGFVGFDENGWSWQNYNGAFLHGGDTVSSGSTWIAGDTIGFTYDGVTGDFSLYKNGVK